jgi:pimeloyl-ACP methyl ester carboxylesterase
MSRSPFVVVALLFACSAPSEAVSPTSIESAEQPLGPSVSREKVAGDVFHYAYKLTVGSGPNARLVVHRVVRERAPHLPRATTAAVMLMHGDFANFATNFAPVLGTPASTATGMATWLAQRGVDVWGFDRRWTQAPAEGADLSDFDAMGIEQGLTDVGTALAFARGVRLLTSGSLDRMTLIGFSRGGQIAYAYASLEAARPPWQRHLKGLVPLDIYAALSPGDAEQRQLACDAAFFEYLDLADGFVDSPNLLQIRLGSLALAAPNDPSPFVGLFPGLTNREAMLAFVGQTYFLFAPSPFYHLAAPVLDGDLATGLSESPENVVAIWLAAAPPSQALREAADTDSLLCGEGPPVVDVPLSRIRVPLFLIAAAGGYGDRAVYTTSLVSSTDVSHLVVRLLPVGREAEDFGHGDLLYADSAPELAWEPLLSWLLRHQ